METIRKARVLKRINVSWHETHWGVIINQNNWGAQIYDPDYEFGSLSQQMWHFAEWFPWESRAQKIQLI